MRKGATIRAGLGRIDEVAVCCRHGRRVLSPDAVVASRRHDVTIREGDGKMKRQIAAALLSAGLFSAGLFSAGSGFLASSSLAAEQTSSANAKDRPIYLTIKDIMESIVDPSADVLWGAAGTVVDKEGVKELAPKTPEEWLDVRRAAVRIVEGGNLLMIPGREGAPPGVKSEVPGVELEPAQITALIKKNRKSFDGFAKALQALGLEALRATEAKSVPSLADIGGRMEDVCEGCHQTFWYPQAKAAATRK
jgi:hypothetical protein